MSPAAADIPRVAKLPRTLANQIAAGEVIERPASVVKELLENAFDAGADRITIDLQAGGGKRIQIRDNGHGIHPDDMEPALERHSTSKLRTQRDLACISSLGFRGEALASIAAAARFTLSSRVRDAETGWRLSIDPLSEHRELRPEAHPPGTTVLVEDLFQAVPARKKFLRAERTEFLQIHELVKRLALSRFGVHIRLSHNGKTVLDCRDSGAEPLRRAREIFGKSFADKAIGVEYKRDAMSLWGWLGLPRLHRGRTDWQYTFINGRLIRDQKIARTIRLAYGAQIPPGRYPTWILYLEMDPALLDVNVHPAKSEVRFDRPRDLHHFLHRSLQDALTVTRGEGALPGLEYPQPPDAPAEAPTEITGVAEPRGPLGEPAHALYTPLISRDAAPRSPPPCGNNPYEDTAPFPYGDAAPPAAALRGQPTAARLPAGATRPRSLFSPAESRLGKPLLLLADRYLLCVRDGRHTLVDARALRAHLLRERLCRQYEEDEIKARPLLVPVMKPVSERHFALLELHRRGLERAGVGIRSAGVNTVRIASIPALLEECNLQRLLEAVCAALPREEGDFDGAALLTAICAAADTEAELTMEAIRAFLPWLRESRLDSGAAAHKGLWRALDAARLAGLLHGA